MLVLHVYKDPVMNSYVRKVVEQYLKKNMFYNPGENFLNIIEI